MIPGRLLHRVAMVLCSTDMRERVVEALLADCQNESLRAATLASRLVAVTRCWASFWVALAGGLINDARFDFSG